MYTVKNNLWAVRLQNSFVDHSGKSFLALVFFISGATIVNNMAPFYMILLYADKFKFSQKRTFGDGNVIITAFMFTRFFYLKNVWG